MFMKTKLKSANPKTLARKKQGASEPSIIVTNQTNTDTLTPSQILTR